MEGEPTTYSGQEDVAAFFDKFEFKKSQVQIITLDSQPLQPPGSPQKDGVLVTVTGNHQVTGMPTKKFVQTFFLATEERRYYIFNDILRAGIGPGEEPAAPASPRQGDLAQLG